MVKRRPAVWRGEDGSRSHDPHVRRIGHGTRQLKRVREARKIPFARMYYRSDVRSAGRATKHSREPFTNSEEARIGSRCRVRVPTSRDSP